MTALLELPDELLELIIAELDSGSLATCCRVSLDLLALASKVLYRDVDLTRQADAALLFCARNRQARASAVAPYLSLVQIRTLRLSLSTSSPAIPTALDLSRLGLKEGSGKSGVLSLEHLVLTYPDHGFSHPSPLFPFLSPSKITFRDACTRVSARDFRLIAYHLVGPGHAMPLASMCLRASVIIFEGCIPRSGGLHAGVAFPITHRQHVQVDLTARFSASLAADLSDQQAHGSNSAQVVSEAFKELWSEVGIPGMAGSSTLVVVSEEHADWLTAGGEEMPPGMEVVVRPRE